MDINQEISAVKDSKGQAIDLVTTKRSAKTSIIVKDKETVVIGGLIQDSENETVNKIPFLGDIPGLGWLFKTKTKIRQKTNLMIMLTPHIVKDAADLAATSQLQKSSFAEALSKDAPLNVREELQIKP
jgi:general secretion pathway protein D